MALAVLLAGVVGFGFVLHEHKLSLEHRLGAAASALAGRQVHVHCQGLVGEAVDVTAEAGSVWFDANGQPADTTDLKRGICGALARFGGDVAGPDYACVVTGAPCSTRVVEDVTAVHVLAHESWHLRGERDEATAECKALQTTAEAARLFGADQQRAQATATYALEQLYPQMPSDYQRGDCVNGGPVDLRPADPLWP